MKIFFRLVKYIKPYHHFIPEYIIYSLLGVIFGLLNFTLLIPILDLLFNNTIIYSKIMLKPEFNFSIAYFKNIFQFYFNNVILTQGKMNALLFACSAVFIFVLMSNLFRYLSMRVMGRLKIKLLKVVRNDIFNKLLSQDLSFHYNQPKGQLVSVIMNDVHELDAGIGNLTQNILRAPFVIIFYMIALFYISASLTFFTILFFPISALIISLSLKKIKKQGHYNQELLGKILSTAEESLSGIKVIKSFNAQNIIKENFYRVNNKFSQISRRMFYQREIASPLSEVLGVTIMMILMAYGGYLILNGNSSLTGSAFIAYLAIYSQMLTPIKDINVCFSYWQKAVASGERIFKIIDNPITINDSKNIINKTTFDFTLEFKNVKFKYQDEWILNNISFKINKGESVALVGKSGSGKTTIIDLLFRFYDIQEGEILLDNINIKNIPQNQLQQLMGIVTQEPFLFNDSVFNNIVLGHNNTNKIEVEKAAEMAFASEFINNLEHKYYTNVGERGMKLSGGQRQRITIARALYHNPAILILDEATASLDTESEQYVQKALDNAMKQRTSIIIAHRLSTIQNVDNIIVLEKGQIIEIGNHNQLIKQKNVYYNLIKMQEFKM